MDVLKKHITGQGQFVDDFQLSDGAMMAVLRSPVAHGKILSLDVEDARNMPGVLDVLTQEDLEHEGVGPMITSASVTGSDGAEMLKPLRPVLATGKVVYLGQPVAAVIAHSQAQAQDALEMIALEIEDLTPVLDLSEVTGSGPIWEDIPQNRSFTWEKGNRAETEQAFERAEHVISLEINHPRMSVAPLETRGCIGRFEDDRFELITGSQGVMSIRRDLAAALGVPQTRLRVVSPDVGGSFAVKIWSYPEHILCLIAAKRVNCPVKWMSSRSESLASDAAGRGRFDRAELAFNSDGKILGFRVKAIADLGAFLNCVSPYVATGGAVRPFGQCYDIAAMHYGVDAVFTNAPPTDAYRGAGKPESAATLERLLDLAAQEIGMDPFELRCKNLVRPDQLPYATPMGETYDGGDFPALATALEQRSDWAGYDRRVAETAKAGLVRGRAVCFHLHATGGSTAERSEVTVLEGGMIRVRTGTQDSGQGHVEALSQVASEALGVPASQIIVEQGDSDALEVGGGTGGSCLMPIAANTLKAAVEVLIKESLGKAAEHLEAGVLDVAYAQGQFEVVGTDRALNWADLAREEGEASCAASADFEGLHTTFPNGGYVVEVELDPETGLARVDRFIGISDVGRVVSLEGVLGQIRGGIVQALGEAYLEELVHSSDGQLITGSMMDYALPRAADIPDLKMEMLETASPNSSLGVKGVGELSSIGAPGVLMNAVIDAAHVRHIDKPLTPSKIWEAMRSGD